MTPEAVVYGQHVASNDRYHRPEVVNFLEDLCKSCDRPLAWSDNADAEDQGETRP